MAATTLTGKVAKIVMNTTGAGSVMFNDKLKDGTRSLKVWGWGRGQYLLAQQLLEQAGCQANIVEFDSHRPWTGVRTQVRLHVVEPA